MPLASPADHVTAPGMTTPLARLLTAAIAASGPMPISRYMAECLGHPRLGYYITRDPLGARGDFTTSPEISQIFGELIGLWFADLWLRAGAPERLHLVEVGPGRGTLMADLQRATARVPGFAEAAEVHLVETSPVLRAEQAKRVPNANWHDSLSTLPDDAPLLLVGNEFLDALPIRQLVRTERGWRERMVGVADDRLVPTVGGAPVDPLVPERLRAAPVGSIVEIAPAALAVTSEIGQRLLDQGGAALLIDYGYEGPAVGDTFQAVKAHGFVDPFAEPGEADLTAQVDFAAVAAAARAAGARVHGPVDQGALLTALGIHERTAALLKRATPAQAEALRSGTERLTQPQAMGRLFKALGLTAPAWPNPAGFLS